MTELPAGASGDQGSLDLLSFRPPQRPNHDALLTLMIYTCSIHQAASPDTRHCRARRFLEGCLERYVSRTAIRCADSSSVVFGASTKPNARIAPSLVVVRGNPG